MKLKHPVRFIAILLILVLFVWMVVNFVIAIAMGEKFSILGNNRAGSGITNLVIAGVDAGGYRTDLILLCQINPIDHKVSVLQVPRDTKVTNHRNDKKINSAYYSGFSVMADELEQVTGIRPEHYIMVSFEAFRDIIDALGGVEIDVPIRMQYEDPVQNLVIDLQPGKQKLNGKQAEMYMRFRKNNNGGGYPEGDAGRLNAHKQFYQAIADKLFSPLGIWRIPWVFSAVVKHSTTDLSFGDMFSLVQDVLAIGKDRVQLLTVPGEGKYIGGGSYFVPYKDKTNALIQENFVTQ